MLALFPLGLALTMSVVYATTTVQGRPSIVTTTLYQAPPSSIATANHGDPTGSRIPVAAIAGGVAAGAVLAIGATIAWIWWGRSIDRAAEKQRREAVSEKKIRFNRSPFDNELILGNEIQHPSQLRWNKQASTAKTIAGPAWPALGEASKVCHGGRRECERKQQQWDVADPSASEAETQDVKPEANPRSKATCRQSFHRRKRGSTMERCRH